MNRNITALILIILAIGMYLTFTKAKWADVQAVRAVNVQYSQAISDADRLIQVRDKVRDDFNSISPADRDRLNKMIPNTVDNIRLIIDLNAVALRRGFTLHGIKAAASGNNGKSQTAVAAGSMTPTGIPGVQSVPIPVLDTVSISFSLSAPYEQFISFLRDLEADLRIMDVTHLSMTATDNGIYDFNVELKTYWLRQQ